MKILKLDNTACSPKQKHVPQRTCIACRSTRGKRDLIRLVSSPGGVEIDPGGKKTGRGVYLCADSSCWEHGLKSNRIEFGLRTKLCVENRQSLVEYGRNLPEKEE